MDIHNLIDEIDAYTKNHVKPKRYEHSVRVAQMCALLCKKFGMDENKGYLVGIGHDMCKDLDLDKMKNLAEKDGNPITDFELKKLPLLHGRAAAVKMKEKFGINDEDILEAVASHVSGKLGMGNLAKILYISDKAEPGRPQSTDEYRAKLLNMDLDSMYYFVLKESYEYIKNKGYEIYPDTEKMLQYCKEFIK